MILTHDTRWLNDHDASFFLLLRRWGTNESLWSVIDVSCLRVAVLMLLRTTSDVMDFASPSGRHRTRIESWRRVKSVLVMNQVWLNREPFVTELYRNWICTNPERAWKYLECAWTDSTQLWWVATLLAIAHIRRHDQAKVSLWVHFCLAPTAVTAGTVTFLRQKKTTQKQGIRNFAVCGRKWMNYKIERWYEVQTRERKSVFIWVLLLLWYCYFYGYCVIYVVYNMLHYIYVYIYIILKRLDPKKKSMKLKTTAVTLLLKWDQAPHALHASDYRCVLRYKKNSLWN